jgi:hypothetical protein
MSDQFWLLRLSSRAWNPFPSDAWHSARGRPACGQRDSPVDPKWSAMVGCARGLWPHKTLYNRFVRWSRMGIFTESSPTLRPRAGRPNA